MSHQESIRRELELSRRMADAVVANAPTDGPSFPFAPGAVTAPEGCPELPMLAQAVSSQALGDALASVAELEEQLAASNVRLAASFEDGDAEAVLAARHEQEELAVRLWAARRDALDAEAEHWDSERRRVEPFLTAYLLPMEDIDAQIRELQNRRRPFEAAVRYTEQVLATIANRAERLDSTLEQLKRGPGAMAVGAGGWS